MALFASARAFKLELAFKILKIVCKYC